MMPFHWVETHGFESMAIAWVIACVISVAPPLPKASGYWTTWAYAVMQLLGASLDKLVQSSPYAKKLDSLAQIKDKNIEAPDGSIVNEHTETSIEVNK